MTRRRNRFGFAGRLEAFTSDRDLLGRAVASVCERHPELAAVGRSEWFGWELDDHRPPRYAAVGCDHRGFVVDAVSGHILWAGEIAGEAELPRSLAAIAR